MNRVNCNDTSYCSMRIIRIYGFSGSCHLGRMSPLRLLPCAVLCVLPLLACCGETPASSPWALSAGGEPSTGEGPSTGSGPSTPTAIASCGDPDAEWKAVLPLGFDAGGTVWGSGPSDVYLTAQSADQV